MLAGCSSTLQSPRHNTRLTQFQASMSTQRLDLPCSFPRKDVSSRPPPPPPPQSQSVRPPVGIETKSLKQSITRKEIKTEEFWGGKDHQGLKKRSRIRFEDDFDEELSCIVGRVKRNRVWDDFHGEFGDGDGDGDDEDEGNWVQSGFGFGVGVGGHHHHHPWGEAEVEAETSHGPVRETGSSSSSESHNVGNPTSGPGFGNGSSSLPNPTFDHGARDVLNRSNGAQTEQQGFELISLLVNCVEAIVSRNIAGIHHYIAKLGDLASPKSRSTICRLIAYFTEALALRVTRVWPHVFHVSVPREFDRFDADDSGASALRLLNQIHPMPKFVYFAGNEMLLKAFEGKDNVHIVDFDIKQGLQWPGFLHSLSLRRTPPSHVRITGVGECKQDLIETGERLAGFADAFNLPFEFHPVVDRLEDVRLWMLHVKEGESVGVNCVFQLHKTLYDPTGGAFRDFMGLVRSTNPIALFMAEQEVDLNEGGLETRVCNALEYYSAIFDSIDSTLPYESVSRVKIEEIFGHEIRNIVACEGGNRVERHERFRKWKTRMAQEGFVSRRVRERESQVFESSKMLLKMYSNDNYNAVAQGEEGEEEEEEEEEEEAITLRWLDQPLYTVSLWVPVTSISGTSSGFSQAT